ESSGSVREGRRYRTRSRATADACSDPERSRCCQWRRPHGSDGTVQSLPGHPSLATLSEGGPTAQPRERTAPTDELPLRAPSRQQPEKSPVVRFAVDLPSEERRPAVS